MTNQSAKELLEKVKLTIEDAYEIKPPSYLEIVDADDEIVGVLEKASDGWQLRVDGYFVDFIAQ